MTLTPWAIAGSAALAVGAGVMSRAIFAPRSQICGTVLFRGRGDGPPRIAITFDDGPHPDATPRVLDILHERQVIGTFFVVGRIAQLYPDLIRRIHAEGHLIGNHSWSHSNWGAFRHKRYWRQELERTDALIEGIIGKRPTLFRPPMGFKTFHITKSAAQVGHATVTWSRRAFDGVRTTERQIIARLSERVSPGDIILLHDGEVPPFHRNLKATIGALPQLIDVWRARGLDIVCLNELLPLAAEHAQHAFIPHSDRV